MSVVTILLDNASLIVSGLLAVALITTSGRANRRIDHLEGRVALLLSAFTTETTVNEAGDVVETITPKVSG
jgi:hypothetical protein